MAFDEGNRLRYHKNLDTILPDVELTTEFMRLLGTHPCAYLLTRWRKFEKKAQKELIFLLFANERQHCDLLAQMLKDSGQDKAANKLLELNRSVTPWMESTVPWLDDDNIQVKVVPAQTMRSGGSAFFKMDSRPRGRAIIFVTEPKLKNEVQRWKLILEQIYFDIEIHRASHCDHIRDTLTRVAKEPHKGNALFVMFIGHGHDEKIQGYGEAPGNEMSISEIVDIFSELNCPALKNKPKIFVCNCCRNQEPLRYTPCVYNASRKQLVIDVSSIDKSWINTNTRTYIIYACAEGEKSWFDPTNGFTTFGNALTLTIAQYAWYKDFADLITMTHKRLEESPGDNPDYRQCPEIRMNTVNRKLFLNPGLFVESEK